MVGKLHLPHNESAVWEKLTLATSWSEMQEAARDAIAFLEDDRRALEDWLQTDVTPSSVRPFTVSVAAVDAKNPTAADFQCDGISDELTIIDALASLPAAGGRVLLSEGTFTLSDPIRIDAAGVTLEGVGRDTVINKTSQNNATDSPRGCTISVKNVRCSIKNMTLGSVTGGTAGTRYNILFFTGPSTGYVSGVRFLGATDGGITVQAGSGGGLLITNNVFETAAAAISNTEPDVLVIGNHFYGNTTIQFSTTAATGCLISNNYMAGGGTASFVVIDNVDGIVITGNKIIPGTVTRGILLTRCRRSLVVGNVISAFVNTSAIEVTSTAGTASADNSIVDNVIYGGTFGAGSGIVISTGGATNNNNFVSGNKITGNVGWGVDVVGAACNTNVVVGNDLRGNTAGALRDTGTGTIILYPGGANGDNFP